MLNANTTSSIMLLSHIILKQTLMSCFWTWGSTLWTLVLQTEKQDYRWCCVPTSTSETGSRPVHSAKNKYGCSTAHDKSSFKSKNDWLTKDFWKIRKTHKEEAWWEHEPLNTIQASYTWRMSDTEASCSSAWIPLSDRLLGRAWNLSVSLCRNCYLLVI